MASRKNIPSLLQLKYTVLCVVLFCTPVLLQAQRYPFYNLNVEDGLIQSQATSLAQDMKGNLWIGTLGGLSRYDGKNFTNYTVRSGMLSNTVWSVAVDSHDNIWAGGPTGISRFDGKSFIRYANPEKVTRTISNTQQIAIVHDTVWWRAQGSLYIIVNGKIEPFSCPGGAGYVFSVLAETGSLLIAKQGVVYRLAHNKWDTLKFDPATINIPQVIYCIYKDKNGTVWMGTNRGLYKAGGQYISAYPVKDIAAYGQQAIFSITEDHTGALWLGLNSGAMKIEGGIAQHYNKHNGLRDNTFLDMFTDAMGNVWMASDGQGVFRFSGAQFTVLDETMGLPSAQVTAIASNRKDSLFLGTYDNGLYLFKEGKISRIAFPADPVPAITALCYTNNSKLWIGTRGGGLWSYQNNKIKQYEVPRGVVFSNLINSLYLDSAKRLWIGFANGAAILEHDSFKTLPIKNVAVVSFLTIGPDSTLIATDKKGGLLLYSSGKISEVRTNTIVDSSTPQCFVIRGRDVWIGSSDNGIIRYNMDSHRAFLINENNGLQSDFIYNIIADNDGNIWTGTGFGIHKIKLRPAAANDTPEITFYGKSQGITGMESNINSVLKLPDGGIWFGTTNGAIHYQPNSTLVSSAPTSIVLQSVQLTGDNAIPPAYYDSIDHWYGIPYHMRLPARKNNLSFTFHAIALGSPLQLLYRYRMDGIEAPWSNWSATNSVNFSALPPGNYTFHVQCQSADKQSNPELAYSFEIITPFQKTKWFRFLIIVACILLGILLQYIVNNMKQRRLKLLDKLRSQEQNKIRMSTAEDFHDEIGNKLTRINVLTNVLKNKIPLTPDSTRILAQIEDNTAQLYSGTRDILWSLKPSNDTLYEILVRISDFGNELFQDTEVQFTFTGIEEKWREYRFSIDMSRNLIMIFKEALNNCLKYAGAKHVQIEATLQDKNTLRLVLTDDGKGFDVDSIKKGNGIQNMNVRAGRLNGEIKIASNGEQGTSIELTFKIPLYR